MFSPTQKMYVCVISKGKKSKLKTPKQKALAFSKDEGKITLFINLTLLNAND